MFDANGYWVPDTGDKPSDAIGGWGPGLAANTNYGDQASQAAAGALGGYGAGTGSGAGGGSDMLARGYTAGGFSDTGGGNLAGQASAAADAALGGGGSGGAAPGGTGTDGGTSLSDYGRSLLGNTGGGSAVQPTGADGGGSYPTVGDYPTTASSTTGRELPAAGGAITNPSTGSTDYAGFINNAVASNQPVIGATPPSGNPGVPPSAIMGTPPTGSATGGTSGSIGNGTPGTAGGGTGGANTAIGGTTLDLGMGKGNEIDIMTGRDASGNVIDRNAVLSLNPGNQAYVNARPDQAYLRDIYAQYGPLNNLGDDFRSYLLNDLRYRANAGYAMANLLTGSNQPAPTALDYMRQGIQSGSVGNPETMRGQFGALMNAISQGNATGNISPVLKSALSDPNFQQNLYYYGLYGMNAANPLYDYMRNYYNRQALMQQMPIGGQFEDYARRLFGLA